jgi:N-terminal domain of anti-restriction factor ArdC
MLMTNRGRKIKRMAGAHHCLLSSLKAGLLRKVLHQSDLMATEPQNASTRRRYLGINVLILWGAVIERGFSG